MVHKEHVKSIDDGFLERIKPDSLPRLPAQYFSAGERVHGHAALAFLVQMGEPGPDIGQLGRQLRNRRRLGRPIKRVLPGGVQMITLGVAVTCRCCAIKQMIGVQQQGLGQTFKKLASFSMAAVTRSCQVGYLSNAAAIRPLSNGTAAPLLVKPYQSTATASARRFWLSSMTWTS